MDMGRKKKNLVKNADQSYISSEMEQGSLYGSSDASASSQPENNSNTLRKRNGQSLQAPQSRLKQSKLFCNENYRILFNETIDLIHGETLCESTDEMMSSQIGTTWWSSEEKSIFFDCLAKKGRNDLLGIATAIGTKTELEVHVYLQLLQKSLVEEHLEGHLRPLCDTLAIPGAFEVSQSCCAELELAADVLAALQEQEDQKLERKKQEKLWLLNTKIARWVAHCHRDGEKGENEIRTCLPAAELLDLKSFLKLSTNMFMNSRVPENNWRYYRTGRAKPSIMYTAFSDFHRLAVSITKRLIQSALFLALSRLRAAPVRKIKPQRAVRRQDVAAALDILDMSHNARDFWVGAARRSKLNVCNSAKGRGFINEPLTFEDIEKALSQSFHGVRCKLATREHDDLTAASQATMQLDESDKDISGYETKSATNSTPSNNGNSLPTLKKSSERQHNTQMIQDNPSDDGDNDAYAEALDKKASQYEEQRLWRLLGKEPPDSIKPDGLKIPKAQAEKSKTADDLEDWRFWVNYVPEWETYETPVPAVDKETNQRYDDDQVENYTETIPSNFNSHSSLAACSNDDDDDDDDDEDEKTTNARELNDASGDKNEDINEENHEPDSDFDSDDFVEDAQSR